MSDEKKEQFVKVEYSFLDRSDLTGEEKMLLILLNRFFNPEKNCAWPSHDTLAGLFCCERKKIGRILKSLEEKGEIIIKKEVHLVNNMVRRRYFYYFE